MPQMNLANWDGSTIKLAILIVILEVSQTKNSEL